MTDVQYISDASGKQLGANVTCHHFNPMPQTALSSASWLILSASRMEEAPGPSRDLKRLDQQHLLLFCRIVRYS